MKNFNHIKDFYEELKTNKDLKIDINTLNEEQKNLYNFFNFYHKTKNIITKEIKKYNNTFLKEKDNPLIKELINNFIDLNSDGKYIRGTLIALSYLDNPTNKEDYYLPLAVSYETFQTAILIHDDIIDNANYRRGKETITYRYNKKFKTYPNKKDNFSSVSQNTSNSLGICIGDLGFYLANQIIYNNYYENKYFNKLLEIYNNIVINTIKGEIIDVNLPFNAKYNNTIPKESDVMEIYKLKTSHYTIIGPFKLGAILNGKTISNNLYQSLENIGVSFQIKDDLLGIYGNSKIIGKSNSSDVSEYKQTILYSHTVNNKDYKDKLLKYYGKNNLTENDLETIRTIFKNSGSYDYAISKINELFKQSEILIKEDNTIRENTKSILLGLITYLKLREK